MEVTIAVMDATTTPTAQRKAGSARWVTTREPPDAAADATRKATNTATDLLSATAVATDEKHAATMVAHHPHHRHE